jgi:hypothetical protein
MAAGAVRRVLSALGWGFLARKKTALGAAVLTLGLALGANTVVFSVLQAFLLSSFGVPDAGRLFIVAPTRELPGRGSVVFADAWPNYVLLREATRSYEELAATLQTIASWDDGSTVRALQASRVTASFFATAGVQPTLGRAFTQGEEGPSPAAVVVVGHDLWREQLGGTPDVIGTAMSLDGIPHTVIGVMPRGFTHPLPTQIWLPFDITEAQRTSITGARGLGIYGRLANGVTPADARSTGALSTPAPTTQATTTTCAPSCRCCSRRLTARFCSCRSVPRCWCCSRCSTCPRCSSLGGSSAGARWLFGSRWARRTGAWLGSSCCRTCWSPRSERLPAS